jgi:hypothetical protein
MGAAKSKEIQEGVSFEELPPLDVLIRLWVASLSQPDARRVIDRNDMSSFCVPQWSTLSRTRAEKCRDGGNCIRLHFADAPLPYVTK